MYPITQTFSTFRFLPSIICLPVILLTCAPFVPTSIGQEKEGGSYGIFDTQQEYYQFIGGAKRAAQSDPDMQAMIPLINDIALGQPVGSTARQYSVTGSEFGLLSNETVRSEIEMVDEQYEDLQKRSAQIQRELANRLRQIDFTDRDHAIGEIREIRDSAKKDLNDMLLPHQVERLKQIRMQTLLRRRSLLDILTGDPIKSELEITDGQTEQLKSAAKEINQELAKKIAKLQEEAREELISKLNSKQQAEVNKMIGDAFDLTQLESDEPKGWSKKGGGKGKGKGAK